MSVFLEMRVCVLIPLLPVDLTLGHLLRTTLTRRQSRDPLHVPERRRAQRNCSLPDWESGHWNQVQLQNGVCLPASTWSQPHRTYCPHKALSHSAEQRAFSPVSSAWLGAEALGGERRQFTPARPLCRLRLLNRDRASRSLKRSICVQLSTRVRCHGPRAISARSDCRF